MVSDVEGAGGGGLSLSVKREAGGETREEAAGWSEIMGKSSSSFKGDRGEVAINWTSSGSSRGSLDSCWVKFVPVMGFK